MQALLRHRNRLAAAAARYSARLTDWRRAAERGDVPGWVLITIMTAGLVAALWLVAEPLLSDLFVSAVSGVSGP